MSTAVISTNPEDLRREFRLCAMEMFWRKCAEKKASFDAGPLLWITDPEWGTKTEDSHWMDKGTEPVAPFPKLEYFVVLMREMLEHKHLFIIKSREMMTSWLVCAYIAWMTQFFPQILWVIQTEKEDKVQELITYCRILYNRQPPWMQAKNPIKSGGKTEIVRHNGSRIVGVPAGENQIRVYHPYGYFQDESAFLPEAAQCYDATAPVAKQIIGVSSDELGWFHNECAL